MKALTRLLLGIMLTLSIVFACAGNLQAATARGLVKHSAPEAQLFTLHTSDDKLLLISWSKQTKVHNLKHPGDIKVDDYLLVDYQLEDDQLLATTVTLPQVTLPHGISEATIDQSDQFAGTAAADQAQVLIDVRPAGEFDTGHIPGAKSIPLPRIVKRTAGLLPADKNCTVIFYDNGVGMNDAITAAELTGKNGYSRVLVLKEGVRGWLKSGRFLASTPAFIRRSKPALIDLRSAEKVLQGHIEAAANFPLAKLAQMYGNLPRDQQMPLVVYGENDRDALAGAAILRNWGYRNVTFLRGGTAAWLASAEALVPGPADDYISSAAAGHSGQLQPSDFELAVNSPQTVELVDVRSDADYRKGHLPTGVHIPLQSIAKRHKELSRNKIQVVFAAETEQAKMAYYFLRDKGYRVNFLGGAVTFDQGGYQVK